MAKQHQSVTSRLVRLPEVLKRVGWSRSQLYKQIERGRFPRPARLSERTVAWLEADIDQWIEERVRESLGGES